MAADSSVLEGGTPLLAAARLGELVFMAAQASHVQIENTELHADSSTKAVFVPVQVRASLAGELGAVTRFLAEIEQERALLIVREAALEVTTAQPSASGSTIRANVLVEGLARNATPRKDLR